MIPIDTMSSITAAGPNQVGHCCALHLCKQPNAKIAGKQNICMYCDGYLHGIECSFIKEPQETEDGFKRLICNLCHSKPAAVTPGVMSADHPVPSTTDQPAPRITPLADIQQDISALLIRPWTSSLHFPGHLCILNADRAPDPGAKEYEDERDLFLLTDKTNYMHYALRFDPQKYPVSSGTLHESSNADARMSLVRDICSACSSMGGCNLKHRKVRDCIQLRCSCFRYYEPNSKTDSTPGSYRRHSLIRDRANQRSDDGLSQKKTRNTSKPVRDDKPTCPCMLVIKMDSHSFYLVCGRGEKEHRGHAPRTDLQRTTFVSETSQESQEFAKVLANKGVGPRAIAQLVEDQYGYKLTRRQIARCTYTSKLASTVMGAQKFEEALKTKKGMSHVDMILENFKEDGTIYTALFHRKVPEESQSDPAECGDDHAETDDDPDVEAFFNWIDDDNASVSSEMRVYSKSQIDDDSCSLSLHSNSTESDSSSSIEDEESGNGHSSSSSEYSDNDFAVNNSSNDTLWMETTSTSPEKTCSVINETSPGEENEGVMKYARMTRHSRRATDDQVVMVTMVWTSPKMKQYFFGFP